MLNVSFVSLFPYSGDLTLIIFFSEVLWYKWSLEYKISNPGANIDAQTEETQETALTLAYCSGSFEVAEILIRAGANIELGDPTPLMIVSQEGYLELVR